VPVVGHHAQVPRRDLRRSLAVETAVTVAGLVATYVVLPLSGWSFWFGVAAGVVVAAVVVLVVARRIRRVLRTERPVPEAIAAVVVTATMALVASSSIYYALAEADPGNFRGLSTKLDAVYFAVTVMTTTGFGDIAPLTQPARAVTTGHIVFMVVLLGAAFRLITWAARQNISRRKGAPEPGPDR
jgi:voltage-gated potassium channel